MFNLSRRLVAHIRELLQEEEAHNGEDRGHDMGAPFSLDCILDMALF